MLKEGKFGVHEAICLVTIAMSNKVLFTAPGFVTRDVGTAAWFMTLISCACAAVCFTFVYVLLKRFPGKNIIEIYDVALGRITGFAFSFALLAAYLAYSGIYTREFAEVMKIYNFNTTPISVLIASLMIVAAVSVFLGLETIARTAKLAAYFALFGFFVLLLLLWPYYKTAHLLPILGYGIGKTVYTGVLRTTAYAEVMLLAVFAGSLQGARHIKKAGYASLVLTGFILTSGIVVYSLIFEYTSTEEITAPIYVVSTLIRYGLFFQKMDPIFLFVWIITTAINISILFYATVSIYCKLFRIQDRRPVIVPMAVLVFAVAMVPKDFPGVVTEYIQRIRMFGNIPFFILPVIALIVAVLRKKKGDSQNA